MNFTLSFLCCTQVGNSLCLLKLKTFGIKIRKNLLEMLKKKPTKLNRAPVNHIPVLKNDSIQYIRSETYMH